jgi:hypothetical protein
MDRMPARLVGVWVILALLTSQYALALPGPQQASPNQEEPAAAEPNQAPPAAQPGAEPLPDSPGAGQSPAAEKPASQSEPPSQPPPPPQQNGNQKPVGTAAAETSTTTGFAASKPAGEALAPAKQKRTRTILISLAAVVGAAVAVGTVVALSKGTSSKPPGSQ